MENLRMTEADILRVMRLHADTLFPRSCRNCGRIYPSPRNFFENTAPVGSVISYDADAMDWTPSEPLGTLGFFNCNCGNTLTLGSEGMELEELWGLMEWAKSRCEASGIPLEVLLNDLREKLYHDLCRESDAGAAEPP